MNGSSTRTRVRLTLRHGMLCLGVIGALVLPSVTVQAQPLGAPEQQEEVDDFVGSREAPLGPDKVEARPPQVRGVEAKPAADPRSTPPKASSDNAAPTAGSGAKAPPANDNFPGQTISGAAGRVFGTNVDATGQPGEPVFVSTVDTTVWYSFTAPESGPTTLNVRDAAFDTLLSVYTGGVVNALTFVAGNHDYFGSLQSKVTFTATAGTVYRIRVDGWSAASGAFSLQWAQNPPANDDFPNRTVLGGPTGRISEHNFRSTGEPGEPSAGSTPDASVWYSWTAPESGPAVMTTKGSDFDTVLGIFTGSALTGLTQVAANDQSGGTNQSRVTFNAVAGTVYSIVVDGFGSSTGNIMLQWSVNRPAYDDFATPQVIQGYQGYVSRTTVRSTGEPGEPDFHGGTVSDNSVWFSWNQGQTAPAKVRLRSVSAGFSPQVAVYTGASVDTLTPLGASGTEAAFNAVAGVTYRIAVDGFSGTTGTFALEWILGKCNGLDATIIGFGTINGTAGNDVIVGSEFNDTINGLAGNDTICALGREDVISGGDGNDRIYGGFGHDRIDGGLGADYLRGDDGDDTFLEGGAANGADILDGGAGIDLVKYDSRTTPLNVSLNNVANDGAAGEGDNVMDSVENVRAGTANDVIVGSAANNVLYGGLGSDNVSGLGGNDTLELADGAGGDIGDGGAGVDTATSDPGDSVIGVP